MWSITRKNWPCIGYTVSLKENGYRRHESVKTTHWTSPMRYRPAYNRPGDHIDRARPLGPLHWERP